MVSDFYHTSTIAGILYKYSAALDCCEKRAYQIAEALHLPFQKLAVVLKQENHPSRLRISPYYCHLQNEDHPRGPRGIWRLFLPIPRMRFRDMVQAY